MMGGEDLALGWRDLQDMPVYVKRFCWDLLLIKRRCIADRAERQRGGAG